MIKNKFLGRIIASLAVLATAASLITPVTVAAKDVYDFKIELNAGINDQLLVGYGAPFYITIENIGSNFEGEVQMIVPGSDNKNTMFAKEISIAKGDKKTILFNTGFSIPAEFVNIRMVSKKSKGLFNKNKVDYSELQKVNVVKDKKEIRIAALTDDFSALSYMDRKHFISDDSFYTTITELNKDTLIPNAQALEMFDVMVISDFSTDLLTKEQIEAIATWTSNGGLLIIGTGSTATKTLSGFKGSFADTTVGNTNTVSTSLGVATEKYDFVDDITQRLYQYNYGSYHWGNSTYSDPYYDTIYSTQYYYWDYPTDYEVDGPGVKYDRQGNLVDNYGKIISPDYWYLFDGDAYYQDPLTNEMHYKYYEELFGPVDENNPDYQDFVADIINYDLDNNCMVQYFELWCKDYNRFLYDEGYTDSKERREIFDDIFGADYAEFCKYFLYARFCYEKLEIDSRPDIWGSYSISSYIDSMNIDVREIEVPGAIASMEIMGDAANDNEYSLAKVASVGEGYLAVFGIDFTKNPIPQASYAGDFFRNIVERIIGGQIITENAEYSSDFSSSYSYFGSVGNSIKANGSALYDVASAASVPPTLVYFLVIGAYLLFVLVIYLVLKKKNKTRKLWTIYPISALGFMLFVFSISFSTRPLRMVVNTISVIEQGDVLTKERDFINVITPKKKEYDVKFSNDITIDTIIESEKSYMSYLNPEIDYDSYVYVYREDTNIRESIINNNVSLSNTDFYADSSFINNGKVSLTLATDPNVMYPTENSINIKNDYSTDLEDVFLIFKDSYSGWNVRYFNKIKAGEKVIANSGKYNSTTYYSYYNGFNCNELIMEYNVGKIVSSLLIGDIIPSNRNFMKRSNVVEKIPNMYDMGSNDYDYMLISFPKGNIGNKILENKNVKEYKYEVIVAKGKYDSLVVE